MVLFKYYTGSILSFHPANHNQGSKANGFETLLILEIRQKLPNFWVEIQNLLQTHSDKPIGTLSYTTFDLLEIMYTRILYYVIPPFTTTSDLSGIIFAKRLGQDTKYMDIMTPFA